MPPPLLWLSRWVDHTRWPGIQRRFTGHTSSNEKGNDCSSSRNSHRCGWLCTEGPRYHVLASDDYTELREYISKWDICLSYRPLQSNEPLLQHDIPDRPWAKIGADFCELNGRMLLVVCNYYSNYEVESLQKCNGSGTIKVFKFLLGCQIRWSRTMGHSLRQRNLVLLQKLGISCISHHHLVIRNKTGKLKMLFEQWKGCSKNVISPGSPSFWPCWTGATPQQRALG